MERIEIMEIFSNQIEDYKTFLDFALRSDEESILITSQDNVTAPFPTKDRNDSFTLGAYVKNALAGVVSFSRDGEDREKLRHKAIIFTMYVRKEFRGRGIARQLLEETLRRAKSISGIEQINLIVVADNLGAARLYRQFGFEKFGNETNSVKWKEKYFAENHMALRL
jgi:RimJ/RimL family protein N-acetyltransferase